MWRCRSSCSLHTETSRQPFQPFSKGQWISCRNRSTLILLLERVRAAIAHDAEQRTKSFDAVATREGCIEMDRRGRTYENIARRLGTSYNTVKNQRASILRKLDADSVVDVVRMVAEHEKG